MKRLTPMEIFNKDFKHAIRGYDIEEVNEFLDLVIRSYEDVLEENEYLKQQIRQLKNQSARGQEQGLMSDERDEIIDEMLARIERLEQIVFGK